uniref:Sulfotransferase n=1 Tax=Watasenia scintillans TaxID=6625 RepID=A0A3T0XDD0_WATSC|nr:sulfotransferase [Watasenia scintillans]
MPSVCHIDKEGYKHWGLEYEGLKVPMFPGVDENIANLPEMEIYDGDVLLLSFPKSGTHWIWEILTMVRSEKAEYTDQCRLQHFLEFCKQEKIAANKARLLTSHLPLRLLPPGVQEKKIKTVMMARNLKDIAVSFYSQVTRKDHDDDYQGSFEGFLDIFMAGQLGYGSWFDYMLDWQKSFEDNPDWPVHIILFEDLKEDPTREIQKLARYLGKNDDAEHCSQIAEKCHIDRLKEIKPEPMMKFFRKGIVGDWKNLFSQDQNDEFEETYKTKAADLKQSFRFEI